MPSDAFEKLREFLEKKMSMSHIYQPAMLQAMLKGGGRASLREIAREFLGQDESQIEYYEQITNKMPGQVLRKHGIVVKEKDSYVLADGYGGLELSEEDRLALIEICQIKLQQFMKKRGDRIWEHRKGGLGRVPGKTRYEVLKKAGFRCELCGVSGDERALEVDHILPKSRKGEDHISNYQALCWKCNANKGAGDDTDFRGLKGKYEERDHNCAFCDVQEDRNLIVGRLAYSMRDKYPVSEGHTLIIPKRHVSSYFDLFMPEISSINRIVQAEKEGLAGSDSSIKGFNVGINDGVDAGQTIFHCHVHLIPRRHGDTPNPRGGVRWIFPDRADYKA